MLLTSAQRKQYEEELAKELPGFEGFKIRFREKARPGERDYLIVRTPVHQRPLYGRIAELDMGFGYMAMLQSCCGVYDISGWKYGSSVPADVCRNFKLLIDTVQKGTDFKTGALITTTNGSYTAVNTLLLECGFIGNTFYNANSQRDMTLWTLVLHPNRGK